MTALARFACWFALSTAATAGVIQGVVLENASARPLARTRIELRPVPGSDPAAKPLSTRAGRSGTFLFPAVPDGSYLLTAIRQYYFPAAYGQHAPTGQGRPIQVVGDSNLFAELRMRRMGAITGRILDENGIGIADVHVVAYRARLPMRIARDATSDDRGVYRIFGLEPGKYWVRSAPFTLEDGSGLLPTFGPESRETNEARTYPVTVDSETPDADIRPISGALFHLGGYAQCIPAGASVQITLATETGHRGTTTVCGETYLFESLAPAAYEVYGETTGAAMVGFTELFLDHDSESVSLQMSRMPHVTVRVEGPRGVGFNRSSVTLSGRRQDLTETGTDREIKIPDANLAPGHWEMAAHAGPGEYVESITSPYGNSMRTWRAERSTDWFETFIGARGESWIRVVVSGNAATITGVVQDDSGPLAGIPVFLWPVAEQARRSLHGAPQAISDVTGHFQFAGLPPGDYKLVATFDLVEVDEESMDEARAITIHVDVAQTANTTLTPWVAPY